VTQLPTSALWTEQRTECSTL